MENLYTLMSALEARGHKCEVVGTERTSRLFVDGVFYGHVKGDRVFRC